MRGLSKLKRLSLLIVALVLLVSTAAHAQTRVLTLALDFNGYGAQNPVNGGSSDFLYPWMFSFPNCASIVSITSPPWDPNGLGTDYYLSIGAGNPGNCNGGASPNPAQGAYVNENAPHRAHDVVFGFMEGGTVTSPTFILRLNDCTHGSNTGVYRNCIDYTAPFIDTNNKLESDLPGDSGTSAALVPLTWHQGEYCYVSGVNGSGTIPPKSKFWLDSTQFLTFGNSTTPNNVGGGNGITLDCELGGGGSCNFGYVLDFDTGTDCPSTALGQVYDVSYQPSSNFAAVFAVQTAASNYLALNGLAGANGYIHDATVGDTDVYNLIFGTHASIIGVTTRASVEKSAAGVRVSALGYKIGSTVYTCPNAGGFSTGGDTNQAYVASATQLGTYQEILCSLDKDPSTGSAWSGTGDIAKPTISVNN